MPQWETGPYHVFLGPIVKRKTFQGTDGTVGDLLFFLGRIAWDGDKQTHKETHGHRDY